jgi:hypothetical protein
MKAAVVTKVRRLDEINDVLAGRVTVRVVLWP